jgi:hypothetical protein
LGVDDYMVNEPGRSCDLKYRSPGLELSDLSLQFCNRGRANGLNHAALELGDIARKHRCLEPADATFWAHILLGSEYRKGQKTQ